LQAPDSRGLPIGIEAVRARAYLRRLLALVVCLLRLLMRDAPALFGTTSPLRRFLAKLTSLLAVPMNAPLAPAEDG
jgi:hypothetical protein